MPDVTSKPLLNKEIIFIKKKSIILFLILICSVVAMYFGYEWYVNQQFITSTAPIYKSSVTLSNDIERFEKDEVSLDSIEEIKEIGNSIKLLKLRAAEIPAKTKQSYNIQDTLITMLEIQLDRVYYLIAFYDNDAKLHELKKAATQIQLKDTVEQKRLEELLAKNRLLKQKYVESTNLYVEQRRQLSNVITP